MARRILFYSSDRIDTKEPMVRLRRIDYGSVIEDATDLCKDAERYQNVWPRSVPITSWLFKCFRSETKRGHNHTAKVVLDMAWDTTMRTAFTPQVLIAPMESLLCETLEQFLAAFILMAIDARGYGEQTRFLQFLVTRLAAGDAYTDMTREQMWDAVMEFSFRRPITSDSAPVMQNISLKMIIAMLIPKWKMTRPFVNRVRHHVLNCVLMILVTPITLLPKAIEDLCAWCCANDPTFPKLDDHAVLISTEKFLLRQRFEEALEAYKHKTLPAGNLRAATKRAQKQAQKVRLFGL